MDLVSLSFGFVWVGLTDKTEAYLSCDPYPVKMGFAHLKLILRGQVLLIFEPIPFFLTGWVVSSLSKNILIG